MGVFELIATGTTAELHTDIEILSFFLEIQSTHVHSAFMYCLCVILLDAGKMQRVEILPGEVSPVHVFQTVSGDRYSVHRPPISPEAEVEMMKELRNILNGESQT